MRHDVIAAITMVVMMGLTWVFGFLMILTDDPTILVALAWSFTIFNTAQVKPFTKPWSKNLGKVTKAKTISSGSPDFHY